MPNPIVQRKTDAGEVRSKLMPGNLEPGEAFPLVLRRVSHPYDGKYGPYLFAQVQTPDGSAHTVIVGHNVKAPGFPDDGETTAFEDAYHEEFGEYPQRQTPGRSLADCFYDAPVDSDETRLIRQTGETEDGAAFNLYDFGVPDEQPSAQDGINWRD